MSSPTGIHVIFGTGPIGLATADALLKRGHRVRVISRTGSAPLPVGAEAMSGDASDPAFAKDVAQGASAIYQILGPPYHRWAEEFPPLQASLVSAAQAAGATYVSFENLYMYGDPEGAVITEDSPIRIHTRKGKLRQEMAESLKRLGERGDLRLTTARASDYFGPRAKEQSQLGERAIGRALEGKSAQIVGNPDTRHSLTYTKDAGAVLATLGTDERAIGDVWHIPNAPARTLRQMIALVGEELGQTIRVSPVPRWLLTALGVFQPALREVTEMLYAFEADYIVESDKFSDAFGFGATPVEQAVAETVEWWRR